jgi:hypothetical protein
MLNNGGIIVVQGVERRKEPGPCGVMHDQGQDYLVYYSYHASNQGIPTLRIIPVS